MTVHRAWRPQVPGQGSWHFWFKHANVKGQSELITHSGLQDGGAPIKLGTHEHIAWPFISWHREFGPHGDGLQGCFSIGAINKIVNKF